MKILIVDDSAVERRKIEGMLRRPAEAGGAGELTVRFAVNGRDALARMAEGAPDLVLTDLQMPEMDGLELVEEVRAKYPSVPVILMTGQGSEEIAVRALHRGAASYVPKRNLARDLVETVDGILALTDADRARQRVLGCLARAESHFVLDNDISLIPPLVSYLQEQMRRTRFCDEGARMRVGIAVREALSNAIEHGNLEGPSALKDADHAAFHRLIAERREQPPYRDRRTHVTVRESPADLTVVIRDEGRGFSPADLPDPTAPENMERAHGRGLLLIRTFVDEVAHNAVGNEITLRKRRDE